MPSRVNETVVATNEIVTSLTEDVVLKHEPNHTNNTINNRAFAFHVEGNREVLVEVVRRGNKTTRVRISMDANTPSYLIPADSLIGYTHLDGRV